MGVSLGYSPRVLLYFFILHSYCPHWIVLSHWILFFIGFSISNWIFPFPLNPPFPIGFSLSLWIIPSYWIFPVHLLNTLFQLDRPLKPWPSGFSFNLPKARNMLKQAVDQLSLVSIGQKRQLFPSLPPQIPNAVKFCLNHSRNPVFDKKAAISSQVSYNKYQSSYEYIITQECQYNTYINYLKTSRFSKVHKYKLQHFVTVDSFKLYLCCSSAYLLKHTLI